MKFRKIKIRKQKKLKERSITKSPGPTVGDAARGVVHSIGKGLENIAGHSAQSLGTDPYAAQQIGKGLQSIGKQLPSDEEREGEKSQNFMGAFLNYIKMRNKKGVYDVGTLSISNVAEYPETIYVKALLPDIKNPDNTILPIADVTHGAGPLQHSLSISDPKHPFYRSTILSHFMLNAPLPNQPEIESGDDATEQNMKIQAWNHMKNSHLNGKSIMTYIIDMMRKYGIEIDDSVNEDLQEYFYKLIHSYVYNNYAKVLEGAQTSHEDVIIADFFKYLATLGG